MISLQQERAAFDLYIKTWGEKSQIIIAIEEMAELQKELTKYLRGNGSFYNLMEEVADVEITIDAIKYMFFDSRTHRSEIDRIIKHKIERGIARAAEKQNK